jgi:hypothetical protein
VRAITGHLLAKAGYNRAQAQTGAVTLIQRFGSALNLNIHFHMLFLDGLYLRGPDQRLRFVSVAAPTPAELAQLIEQISQRVARHLERQGWLVRDEDNSYLAWDAEQASALDDVIGHAAFIANTSGRYPLFVENAVPRRHHPRHLRTIGFHCPTGGADTQATSQSHPLPWGICPEQSLARAGHPGQTR